MELIGRMYPYLPSSAALLLPQVLAHGASYIMCRTQCKMKMHSPVGWGSEPPLPSGPSPQHTKNGRPPRDCNLCVGHAVYLNQEWVRGHCLALSQMPRGLHLTLILLHLQTGPARSRKWQRKWSMDLPHQRPRAEGSRDPRQRCGEGGVGQDPGPKRLGAGS